MFGGVLKVAFQRKKPAVIDVKAPFPGFVEPALATSNEKVPAGERWIHEIKFDGYRVLREVYDSKSFLVTCQYFNSTGFEETVRQTGYPSSYSCPRFKV